MEKSGERMAGAELHRPTDPREPFRIVLAGSSAKAEIPSCVQSPVDSWDDDAQHRIAELFLILDRWDRTLDVEQKERHAA